MTGLKQKLISIHLEIVLILTQIVAGLRRTYPRLGNHFGRAQWNSYMTWVMSNLVLIRLETVLVSVQIGAQFAPNIPWLRKSFCTQPMVLLGDEAQVEAHSGPFGDSVNLDSR